MATSIYIFDNMEEYKKIYGEKFDLLEYKVDLVDLWIKGDKLWIVTNTNDQKEQPQLSRTLVHFRQGSIDNWKEGDEKLVLHGKIRFNLKRDHVEFFPRFLRKPLLWLRVGRFHGKRDDKYKQIDYEQRFYDFHNDRIVFVCEDKNGRN
jgi:hypothetical protein